MYQRMGERRLNLAIAAGANPTNNAAHIVERYSSHGMMTSSFMQ